MLLGGGVGDGGQPRQGICSVQPCEVSDTLLASTSTVAVQVPTRVGHAGWTPYTLPERRQALAAGGDVFLSRVRGDGGVRLQVSSEGVCVSDAYDLGKGWTFRWSEVAAVLYDASDTMIMVATIGGRVEVRAQRWTPGVLDSVRRHAPSDLLRSVPVTAAPGAALDGVPLQGDLKRRRRGGGQEGEFKERGRVDLKLDGAITRSGTRRLRVLWVVSVVAILSVLLFGRVFSPVSFPPVVFWTVVFGPLVAYRCSLELQLRARHPAGAR
jgi:hypothetical protein